MILVRTVLLFGLVLNPWLLALNVRAKLTPEQLASIPAPVARAVSFRDDIQPILESACVKCHGKGKAKGGFSLETRDRFLKGGDSGPTVVEGKADESYLLELVSGVDPSNVMPKKGSKLTATQVALIRAWINQGLPWDSGIHFGKQPSQNLFPREVTLPPIAGSPHPIDRILGAYLQSTHQTSPKPIDDTAFLRRLSLDVSGVLPSPQSLEEFIADKRANKRELWVDRLLGDNPAYATHWLSFWNDLLRNDYRGTGYIDGGRKQISRWLYSALATNMPYDEFVRELVHPNEQTEGFTKGIVWRGVVNASQTPQMQAAQNISQVFLGVNLKCASCHDSFINDWSLADSYGLASIYADEPLELVECDKPTGKKSVAKFLFSEVGVLNPEGAKTNRTAQLAELMTSKKNGRLTRTLVNRLWSKLYGRGLVEPLDDMDQRAWNQDLLDWLAEDFVAHGYNMKHALRQMLTAQAYQWPAVNLPEQKDPKFVFTGPAVRRLSAEQFRDALGTLTGVWHSDPASEFDLALGASPEFRTLSTVPDSAHWVWSHSGAETNAAPGELYLRKSVVLESLPTRAAVVMLADDSYQLFVNGTSVLEGKDLKKAQYADLVPHLKVGENLFAIHASNATPKRESKDKDSKKNSKEGETPKPDPLNPAGVVLFARLEFPRAVQEIGTDKSWMCTTNNPADWKKPDFGASAWVPATEVATANQRNWNAKGVLMTALSMAIQHDHIRGSLVPADPLTTALGRPNREQVMTFRASAATTLQALELSNGETLAKLLKEGATRWAQKKDLKPKGLVQSVFRQALCRKPTEKELGLCLEALGPKMKPEQIEDFLWTVAMLPEFQLIY